MILYDRFFHLLEEKHISVSELQTRCSISRSTLHHMKQGKSIRMHTIDKLCAALACRPEDLMEFRFTSEDRKRIKNMQHSNALHVSKRE